MDQFVALCMGAWACASDDDVRFDAALPIVFVERVPDRLEPDNEQLPDAGQLDWRLGLDAEFGRGAQDQFATPEDCRPFEYGPKRRVQVLVGHAVRLGEPVAPSRCFLKGPQPE